MQQDNFAMKYLLGLLVPYAIFFCQLGFYLLVEYKEADKNRTLQMPPSDLNMPMQAQVFYPSLANVVWCSLLLFISLIGAALLIYGEKEVIELMQLLQSVKL